MKTGQTKKLLKILNANPCCDILCNFPIGEDFALPLGLIPDEYSYSYTLKGTAPFNVMVITKPSWMTITITGNVITFSGTPVDPETVSVAFRVVGCDKNVSLEGQVITTSIETQD